MKTINFFEELLKQIDLFTLRLNQGFSSEAFSQISPFKHTDLSATEKMTVINSYIYGTTIISVLGRLCGNLKPSHIGAVVNGLAGKGLVKKSRTGLDERVCLVELTAEGHDIAGRHINNCIKFIDGKLSAVLNGDEIGNLAESLILVLTDMYRYIDFYGIIRYNNIISEYEDKIKTMSLYELLDRRTQFMNLIFLNMDADNIFFNKEKFNFYQNNVVLYLYDQSKAASITKIANDTGINIKYLSGIIKGLANKGFVRKFLRDGDERTRYVELSEKSKLLIKEQDLNEKKFFQEKFSQAFSDEELDTLLLAHIRINEILDLVDARSRIASL